LINKASASHLSLVMVRRKEMTKRMSGWRGVNKIEGKGTVQPTNILLAAIFFYDNKLI
jgi:hypothetical protein